MGSSGEVNLAPRLKRTQVTNELIPNLDRASQAFQPMASRPVAIQLETAARLLVHCQRRHRCYIKRRINVRRF